LYRRTGRPHPVHGEIVKMARMIIGGARQVRQTDQLVAREQRTIRVLTPSIHPYRIRRSPGWSTIVLG
jgi:hypothetical protein